MKCEDLTTKNDKIKVNYHMQYKKELEKISLQKSKPTLLLHICCAPCSSGCIEKLNEIFDIKVLYYNPNISPVNEFEKRKNELNRFLNENPSLDKIEVVECEYDSEKFKEISKGLENLPEGGARCEKCFRLRLEKSASICKNLNLDYFTTTLSISPYKNAVLLNEIGLEMAEKYGVKYLVSDFKKENGYKNSIEQSEKYNLYRQDYCGCIYSKLEREQVKKEKSLSL